MARYDMGHGERVNNKEFDQNVKKSSTAKIIIIQRSKLFVIQRSTVLT